ncbi:MAG: hypothetical protein Q4F35_06280, partial [Akkermansia sp.]|nr:hypothetical protein [Akkermansia sp.]
ASAPRAYSFLYDLWDGNDLQFIYFAGFRLKNCEACSELAAALGLKPRSVNGIYNLRIPHLQFIEIAGFRLKNCEACSEVAAALGRKPRSVNGGISLAC